MDSAAYLTALRNTPLPLANVFSEAEYTSRLDRVRAAMDAAALDVVLVTAWCTAEQ